MMCLFVFPFFQPQGKGTYEGTIEAMETAPPKVFQVAEASMDRLLSFTLGS